MVLRSVAGICVCMAVYVYCAVLREMEVISRGILLASVAHNYIAHNFSSVTA